VPEGRISFALKKNNLFADADAVGNQGLGATCTHARKPPPSQIRNIFSNYREKLASMGMVSRISFLYSL
jgi:hypothetical protein